MGSSHLSSRCLEEKGQNIRNGTNTFCFTLPYTRKQPSVVVDLRLSLLLPCLFLPPIFSSDHYLSSHTFLLFCFFFSLRACFPFRSVPFFFLLLLLLVQQFLLFVFTFVNVGYRFFVCAATRFPSSRVHDRKRLSSWLDFPPQLRIRRRRKGP